MERMPTELECAYCIRNTNRGGECPQGKKNNSYGCMIFKPDPRGCIRWGYFEIPFPLFKEIPSLNTWNKGWYINEVDTEIKITNIREVKWDREKQKIIICCDLNYFINEYHEDYKDPMEKPKLRVIK